MLVHARSAVVDVYGDHLRSHDWWGPVAGVVALSEAAGVQPAATRTAVSRLVREGWLRAESRGGIRGYVATPLAQDRLEGAYDRIYAPGPRPWGGSWHVVVVSHGGDRRRRDQVAASLGYLGYGRLAPATWISPWPSPELDPTLRGHGATWTAVTGPATSSGRAGAAALAASVWDLEDLQEQYARFARELPAEDGLPSLGPARAYQVRTRLVHQWRKFLFSDPGLPADVLPPDWAGHEARARFLTVAAALRPAAEEFVALALGEVAEAS